MKHHSIYQVLGILFFLGLTLVGCGNAPTTNPPKATPTIEPSKPATSTRPVAVVRKTNTPRPVVHPTSTSTPIMDANGNVTWHPQKLLISWDDSPNDGNNAYVSPNFVLYWDGTLLKPAYDSSTDSYVPSTAKLSQDEICKVLNTVEASGFFEEPNDYNFPFMGAWGSYIGVNTWKSNWSGSQQLFSAVRGAPYYDTLFCRDCPLPSVQTIIRPALANIYYFLQNYAPQNLHPVEINKWHVSFYPSEEKSDHIWPLTSISFEQFQKKCEAEDCLDAGMEIEGDFAKEFFEKIDQDQAYPWELSGDYHSVKMYAQDVWPDAPSDVPPNATLMCNTKTTHYPLLPLNKNNKFWYYAPSGEWGAERVEGQNKMRVVNTSGYEKFYGYDPAFFGQTSIQVYPRYWSADDQFFYVNILPGDFKPNSSLVNSIGLQQIDVKNEKIKYLFLGKQGESFAYEFSPDGKKVAYIRQGDTPLKLAVVNTHSGEEQSVSLTNAEGQPYSAAGTLAWSYHDDKIFLAVTYEEAGLQKGHILVIDANNLADVRLVYQDGKPIKLQETDSYSSADICPIQTDENTNCQIHLDLDTGEIQK